MATDESFAWTERGKWNWILRVGWKGLCPRCGKGSLFRGWLKVREACPVCGLDYRFATPDDGPAFFALCLTAFPLIFFVVWLEVKYAPPIWVHVLTSGPLMAIGTVASLRPFKGWLVASQYVHKAEEAGTADLARKLDRRRD
ncbi:MAG TPA: DUF983 domain-containing protein [Sphingomonas sp.]|nr:DUF983 domain-containing protein [Sphingomonas sp.]